jgi:hypothetical protein
MSIKYTNIFHCNTQQNLPKSGILVSKINHLATLLFSSNFEISFQASSNLLPEHNCREITFFEIEKKLSKKKFIRRRPEVEVGENFYFCLLQEWIPPLPPLG